MRRQSVAFFLGDVGFLSDPKFRKLARRLTDPDEFNSAVGAFWIALAAARRNGLSTIDVASETDSRFIPVLIEVGLLTDDGFPEKAYVAWAPSRPPRVGELRRDVTSAANGDEVVEMDRNGVPSTPIPSSPFLSNPRSKGTRGAIRSPLQAEIGDAIKERYGDYEMATLEALEAKKRA